MCTLNNAGPKVWQLNVPRTGIRYLKVARESESVEIALRWPSRSLLCYKTRLCNTCVNDGALRYETSKQQCNAMQRNASLTASSRVTRHAVSTFPASPATRDGDVSLASTARSLRRRGVSSGSTTLPASTGQTPREIPRMHLPASRQNKPVPWEHMTRTNAYTCILWNS